MGRIETIRVNIPYEPRDEFMPLHLRKQRWAVIVAHRRAGKTVACLNDLQKHALLSSKPNPRYAYIAPYLKQAKDVAWDYMLKFSAPVPGIQANHSELRIDYPNGGRVRLYGADNADGMRGLYFDGVVLDEPADFDPRVWPEILRPALADRQGWAVFIGTPKGKNGFWETWDNATNGFLQPDGSREKSDEWFTLMLKASETGLLSGDELRSARQLMSEDQYEQEMECSFEAAVQGAYYGKLMRQALDDGRICDVRYDPALPVHTGWDLGYGDDTSIWFFQKRGPEIRWIDYYENRAQGLDHYVAMLQSKPYIYGTHILPHDANSGDITSGKTSVQVLSALGVRNTKVLERGNIDDGINAVRQVLPMSYWDERNCGRGIEALRQYRREYDDKRKCFKDKPLHDWTSHPADAKRTACVGMPGGTAKVRVKDAYSVDRKGNGSWMTV